MAQSASTMSRTRVLGEYQVGRQIGSGSFSLVWHGRHRVHGTEVAIKEIVTGRLNKKLQESLLSEIFILKKINHPNIIRLHDIIEVPGRIHLVLEYCRGGDLSVYINRHGKVPEATAKLFMQQLAAGLQVLRDNNLIHRDLKPQNLLLSANDSSSVLKIADFGFARSLQPRGLAETLCGSPLYMAPEIMQLQKYDAKADLWSVGAILYQLVNGKTPFTGNNQIQLLQNIIKATELHFPPDNRDLSAECRDLCQKLLRRNPVERLTFEEFFNHPFLALAKPAEHLRSKRSSVAVDGIASSDRNSSRNIRESSQDDYMTFFLDDDSSGPDGSPSNLGRKSSTKSTYGFSLDSNNSRRSSNILNNMKFASKYGASSPQRCEGFGLKLDSYRSSDENLKEPIKSTDRRPPNFQSRASTVADSLESIDREYVFVSGPPLDMSSSSTSAYNKPNHSQCIAESLPPSFNKNTQASDPMPIVGSTVDKTCCIGGVESPNSPPSATSQGSMDMIDTLEQPSGHCMTRIKSLQQCASDIMDLVNEKMEAGKKLEAFSIQLVILAIWKQALHICHTQAASAMEGSPSQETSRFKGGMSKQGASDMQECIDAVNAQRPEDLCSEIEREFLLQVGRAEELAKFIEPGSNEMPDAMETIFQSALTLGRYGAVDELMSAVESAESLYSKAVRLLMFLLVEAPSLILNPPFSLTNSDRYRLRNYIDILIRQARKVSKDGAAQV